jgi:hypothetical protein
MWKRPLSTCLTLLDKVLQYFICRTYKVLQYFICLTETCEVNVEEAPLTRYYSTLSASLTRYYSTIFVIVSLHDVV